MSVRGAVARSRALNRATPQPSLLSLIGLALVLGPVPPRAARPVGGCISQRRATLLQAPGGPRLPVCPCAPGASAIPRRRPCRSRRRRGPRRGSGTGSAPGTSVHPRGGGRHAAREGRSGPEGGHSPRGPERSPSATDPDLRNARVQRGGPHRLQTPARQHPRTRRMAAWDETKAPPASRRASGAGPRAGRRSPG